MHVDPSTTKYMVKASLQADGVVEKADIIGAIFGQTEGLLGEELDLRELQKSGRIGRIEVEVTQNRGKSEGTIIVPSGLDQIETSILASALETIDRIGPCKARIAVNAIEDVRMAKRDKIINRAKELYLQILEQSKNVSENITSAVRQSVQAQEIISFGKEKLPAGPNVANSDAIIVVEGRSDVLNLLKYGIKNAIAVEGTNIPQTIIDLSREKNVTLFVDGDRGGELILKEMLQVAEVDAIARAPPNLEVEELSEKQIMKCLKNKIPVEQFISMYGSVMGIQPLEKEKVQPLDKEKESGKEVREVSKEKEDPAVTRERERPPFPPLREEKEEAPAEGFRRAMGNAERYKEIFSGIEGQAKTVLTDDNLNPIVECPIAEMIDKIRGLDRVHSVIFDGVISQRLLDVAHERGVRFIIASRIGNVGKFPAGITILLRKDLDRK